MNLHLSPIVESLQYDGLPEEWRVPMLARFFRRQAFLRISAGRIKECGEGALFIRRQRRRCVASGRKRGRANSRKREFAAYYSHRELDVDDKFSIFLNKKNENGFRVLSDFIAQENGRIPYRHFINRMCFWMATGSGKTLVMVKIIAHLRRLIEFGKIPPHRILILAPSDYLIRQIRLTIDEFNADGGLKIKLTSLKESAREGEYQPSLGDELRVCYYRSDNISDSEKDALLDYRRYENGGKWYVLLDEAHKGDNEDSKRQAYYALMSRNGFLFNFPRLSRMIRISPRRFTNTILRILSAKATARISL